MLTFCPARCCMCFCVFYKVATTFGHMKQASKQYKFSLLYRGPNIADIVNICRNCKKMKHMFFWTTLYSRNWLVMSGNNVESALAEREFHDIGPTALVERWATVSNKRWPNVLLQPISNGRYDIEPTFDQLFWLG